MRRTPTYKRSQPNIGNYITYNEQGELLLFTDSSKKREYEATRMKKAMDKIMATFKEGMKNADTTKKR